MILLKLRYCCCLAQGWKLLDLVILWSQWDNMTFLNTLLYTQSSNLVFFFSLLFSFYSLKDKVIPLRSVKLLLLRSRTSHSITQIFKAFQGFYFFRLFSRLSISDMLLYHFLFTVFFVCQATKYFGRKVLQYYFVYCKFSPFLSPSSCVFKCERVRINNSTLASDSPWSHEWNLGNNANHLRCDVDPAERNREQQRHFTEGKHLAKEPQRCTHTRPRAGAWACCSIHHHDEALRSDQSQSVLHQCDSGHSNREGPPVPLLPRRGTQHVATLSYMSHCHSINPARGGERKHSSSEQTRPHKHLSGALQWPKQQNKTLTLLRLGLPVLPVWLHGRSTTSGAKAQQATD